MPKPLIAITLLVATAALPSFAQRGGSVGHGGGFAAQARSYVQAGSAWAGSPSSSGRLHFNGYIRPGEHLLPSIPFNRPYGPLRVDRFRHSYSRAYPLATPYGLNAWIAPGYLDAGLYDDSSNASAPSANNSNPSQNLAPQPSEQPSDQPEVPAADAFRPAYARPQPDPDPAFNTAVTLIFKDGRPSEQVHNYMLTRTTLYVQDQHLRRIPVDQLDLEATYKANEDAGVDFSLPAAVR